MQILTSFSYLAIHSAFATGSPKQKLTSKIAHGILALLSFQTRTTTLSNMENVHVYLQTE